MEVTSSETHEFNKAARHPQLKVNKGWAINVCLDSDVQILKNKYI